MSHIQLDHSFSQWMPWTPELPKLIVCSTKPQKSVNLTIPDMVPLNIAALSVKLTQLKTYFRNNTELK